MMLNLKQHRLIILLLASFVLFNAAFISFYKDIWWDSAVYIGIGKYIYSLGQAGIWEESRPIVLPLILGLGWKIGLNEMIFSKIISLLFSILVLVMVYIIGDNLFSRKTALLSTFFTAFSFIFFFFSSRGLTEIPSLFFALLSFYLLLNKRHFSSGIFAGLCVMTRFYNIALIFIMYGVSIMYFCRKRKFFPNILKVGSGFSIAVLPYLFLNLLLYGNLFYPFTLQYTLTKTTGLENFHGPFFYVSELLKDNFMLLILVASPFFYRMAHGFKPIIVASLSYLVVFSLALHKEPRYLIAILPLLFLLLSACIEQLYNKFEVYARFTLPILIIIWMALTFSAIRFAIENQSQKNNQSLLFFQDEINQYGKAFVTNPLFALRFDGKIDGILYYPSSGMMDNELKSADAAVFYNTCDMQCSPNDIHCISKLKKIEQKLGSLAKKYTKMEKSCEYSIYSIS